LGLNSLAGDSAALFSLRYGCDTHPNICLRKVETIVLRVLLYILPENIPN
jgi:hypothetical protein